MRRRKPTLDAINHDLDLAGKLLDGAAHKLRDAGFAPRRNVRRVGEALASVSAIQFEIYAARPDLLRRFLADTKFGRRVLSNKPLEWSGTSRHREGNRRRTGRSAPSR